ncbi:MAG: metal-dependent hydrolase, partial [Myxococcaceae bacterium]|nr:metal-dependent hydrolase [Myxococcaceae bacterium]
LAVGIATARAYTKYGARERSFVKSALVFAALSMLPDADVVAFALKIPYEHPFGHRGASHSILFALLCTAAAWALAKPLKLPPRATALAALVAVGTHPLLDTLTTGGLGCALAWPFSSERFFAPVRPIPVAPIGLGMLSARGLQVVVVELVMFAPLWVYALVPRRGRGELVPGLAGVGTVALVGVAGLFYRSVRERDRIAPPASFAVTAVREGAPVSELEAEVAVPLERALGARRTRTRVGGGVVRVEVWGDAAPAGPNVEDLRHPLWLVRGERPAGALCGAEAQVPHVHIDPLKLAALNVGALDVERSVKAVPLEELDRLVVNERARVGDVAVVSLASPTPRCSVEGGGWLVRAAKAEGGVRLVSRIELGDGAPLALSRLKPAAVTREGATRVTLWFAEAYDAKQALAELRGHEVRHLDGLKRVRVTFVGPDREALQRIAESVATSLRGALLVVRPREAEPRLEVQVDAARAVQLGLDATELHALGTLALRGHTVEGVRVSIDLAEREHLAALFIGPQRLGEVVSITQSLEPGELVRENGRPAVELWAYGLEPKDVPRPALPPGVAMEVAAER